MSDYSTYSYAELVVFFSLCVHDDVVNVTGINHERFHYNKLKCRPPIARPSYTYIVSQKKRAKFGKL